MERLKVSIICYNAEKTIAKTIASVLSQDYENLEYKIKMYTKNSIKIVLTRLRIWKAFYCLIKRDNIYKY